MKIRKLEQQEHGRTRKLWEEVFPEDTQEFLDYYYYIKTRENEIFTVEEDDEIQSMLQLNPYEIRLEDKTFSSCYIIAVGTRREYRGRGYMRGLLHTSLNEMYGRKIPFTFLMPAAAAIYTPYDFRYIYDQEIREMDIGSNVPVSMADTGIRIRDAAFFDGEKMAQFFERHFSSLWQVYAVHNNEYYKTMIMEQQSEHGGVRLMEADGELVGMFAYAREDHLEIREPLYLPSCEVAFQNAVSELTVEGQTRVRVIGCVGQDSLEKKPVIMARIVCLKELLSGLICGEEELNCSFAVIDPILHGNSRIWKLQSNAGEKTIRVEETENSEGVVPIAELTEFLFGRIGAEELCRREHVILSEHLVRELGKIRPLRRTFFNEVV